MTATTETRSGRRAVWAAGLVVGAGAGVATAHGLYQVAVAARVPAPIGWLYPLITDGLALVAYAATARLHHGGRHYAAGIVVLAAGLSGLAQAIYLAGGIGHTSTAPTGLRFGVGAWPAIAAALTAHLLHLISDTTERADQSPSKESASNGPSNPRLYNASPYNPPASIPTSYNAASNPVSDDAASYSEPSIPAATARPAPDRSTAMNTPPERPTTQERSGSSGSARERARTAAQRHLARHARLPTVTELMQLAEVARGTAGSALKTLRAERPALHVVNADTESRTDQ